MTTYTPNTLELAIARQMGKMRNQAARRAGFRNRRKDPRGDEWVDAQGAIGELCFCNLTNCYPSFDATRPSGYDCIWNGKRVDVKCTPVANGRLLAVTSKKPDDADIYALVTGTWPGPFTWRGWAWADELLRDENIVNLGRGECYGLPQSKLRRPAEG
jgi:hypothetical protein